MEKLKINAERCKGCELCIPFCPKQILFLSDTLNSKGYRTIAVKSQDECNSCQTCAIMCPDVVFEVWRNSGGK